MADLLAIEAITVSYGGIEAVKKVSLCVPAGRIVALVGANGAGKTSLLNAISGLVPAAGSIVFAGEDMSRLPPHERVRLGIAQVPEGRRIFGRMSVAENIEIGAFHRHDSIAIERDFERVLTLFPRLRERLNQVAGTLSGGEQQMLAMARSLMSSPKMLLLDEPSMGLAPQIVSLVFSAIAELSKTGLGVLLVEQNAYSALAIAAQAHVMETGAITLSGSGAELLEHPGVREAYLG